NQTGSLWLSEIQMASSLLTPFPALKGSELIGISASFPLFALSPDRTGGAVAFLNKKIHPF
ncbi:MAG: hypothetical protein UCO29_01770, partial [Blautia hansenii]